MSWLNCSHCGKDIEDNERHYALNLGEEVFEDGAITVIWEDEIKTFCLKCAELHDLDAIQVPLKKHPSIEGSFLNHEAN